jgi:hypothetical protein
LPPLRVCVGVCGGGEPHVEFSLEDMGGTAELGWPSWAEVAGVELGGGTPHLDVGDQLGRHRTMALGRPRRRLSRGVAADLVGELSNKLCSRTQVWSPVRVGGQPTGNARQPRQRPTGGDLVV